MNLKQAAKPMEADTLCRECGALTPAVLAEDYNGLCVRCRWQSGRRCSCHQVWTTDGHPFCLTCGLRIRDRTQV